MDLDGKWNSGEGLMKPQFGGVFLRLALGDREF